MPAEEGGPGVNRVWAEAGTTPGASSKVLRAIISLVIRRQHKPFVCLTYNRLMMNRYRSILPLAAVLVSGILPISVPTYAD